MAQNLAFFAADNIHHIRYTITGTATVVFVAAVSFAAIVEMPGMSSRHSAATRHEVRRVICGKRICDGAACTIDLLSSER